MRVSYGGSSICIFLKNYSLSGSQKLLYLESYKKE